MKPAEQILQADIGVYGLGTMGTALARNLGRAGFRVALCNMNRDSVQNFIDRYGSEGEFVRTGSVKAFANCLTRPRIALVSVTAGPATTTVITTLREHFETGDIVVDCANSHYLESRRREVELAADGLALLSCGVGGGPEGALAGPSLMVGGSHAAYEVAGPYLEAIAARDRFGRACCDRFGPAGAGHFLKMVHNGIEHLQIQLIAEAYQLLRHGGVEVTECVGALREWNTKLGESFLLQAAQNILQVRDFVSGQALVEVIQDVMFSVASDRSMVEAGLELSLPVTAAGAALGAQFTSGKTTQRQLAQTDFGELSTGDCALYNSGVGEDDNPSGTPSSNSLSAFSDRDKGAFIEAVGDALAGAFAISLSQAFDLLGAASGAYGWHLEKARVGEVWRAGCVIRSDMLEWAVQAYQDEPKLELLLSSAQFKNLLTQVQSSWRELVAQAIRCGISLPALTSTLNYFDTLRSQRLPASFAQALRDFTGGLCYQRLDRTGRFTHNWDRENPRETEKKI